MVSPTVDASAGAIRPADFDRLDEAIYEGGQTSQPGDGASLVEWIAAAAEHHLEASPIFARMATRTGFTAAKLRATGDLSSVPILPASVFKRRKVVSSSSGPVRATRSSGTQGAHSVVWRDERTLERFMGSVLHGLREFHGESSVREAFVLSPPASEAEDIWFSYVLTLVTLLYDTQFFVVDGELRPARLVDALETLPRGVEPILVGPPALVWDVVSWMKRQGICLDLSMRAPFVVTAGGWKKRSAEEISRTQLTRQIETRLGIEASAVRDAYNMVELNSVIFECEQLQKHVPPWLAVIVRRPRDLSLAAPGEEGVLSFLDPTATSYPAFILSDDVGSVSERPCGCGRPGPTLRIHRRLSRVEERGCGLKLERYGSVSAREVAA